MLKSKKISVFFTIIAFAFIVFRGNIFPAGVVNAETESEKFERLSREIQQYEAELSKLKSQGNTLSNQIAQFDAQIRLTSLKISQTEEKILLLGGRIDQLETSLQVLTKAFASRVVKTYKMARFNEPYAFFLSSPDLDAAVTSFHYLQKIQESDRDLLVRLEKAQVTYEGEKVDQEELQQQLEEQKSVLGAQKSAKALLLQQTRNDEKKYQSLLAQSRAEYEAIQAIIAGKGQEEEADLG